MSSWQKAWNQKDEANRNPGLRYARIELWGDDYQSMRIVTNGQTWDVDPATVKSNPTLEAAAASCGLGVDDFEEVNR